MSGTITWSRNGEKTGSISVQSCFGESEQYIKFNYSQTDYNTAEKADFDYKIPFTPTPCYFGGQRWWFRCPWYVNGKYCGRRVGILYLGGKYFACRHCYNLCYSSQNVNRRSSYYALGLMFNAEEREAKLREQIKRGYYNGKPTRKQRILDKVRRKFDSYAPQLMRFAEINT